MSQNNDKGLDLADLYAIPQTERWVRSMEAGADIPPRCPSVWKTDEDDGELWQCSQEPGHEGELHVAMSQGYIYSESYDGLGPCMIPAAIWKDEGVLLA